MTLIEIGKLTRERRKFLNITQAELSEIIGISLRSLIDIENGKGNPTLEQLKKLTESLGMELIIKVK